MGDLIPPFTVNHENPSTQPAIKQKAATGVFGLLGIIAAGDPSELSELQLVLSHNRTNGSYSSNILVTPLGS